jgi:pyrophosphate--fructose-6-phosphate 1-phosphotransferase
MSQEGTSSPLQEARLQFQPVLPEVLQDVHSVGTELGATTTAISDIEELGKLFPHTMGQRLVEFVKAGRDPEKMSPPLRVGVVLSGGQAAGGHNVICGVYDTLIELHPYSKIYGFLGGPSGIVDQRYVELTALIIEKYRNQGGFDMIGSGRTKIESPQQLAASLSTAQALELDGLVVIGGDDSNTNAAVLAEYFKTNGCKTCVIGVPKTIDGDLKNDYIATSFGFDTACKVYCEMIGNIARDALSAKKYYHFIKLMGRSASHIALECALETHPNITIIGEEVAEKNYTLKAITQDICNIIAKRAEQGKNYGVVLIPEGLIEFIPEMKILITQLNQILAPTHPLAERLAERNTIAEKIQVIEGELNPVSKSCFENLSMWIKEQLLLDRDPHGNVQVSKIETEKLLMDAVSQELRQRAKEGTYTGKFNAQQHFLGYEGRCAMPSNFDAQYCYALGKVAALLVNQRLTGYMARIKNLHRPVEHWEAGGIPITMLMNIELRHGHHKPVIQKALVRLSSRSFNQFRKERDRWALEDCYRYPGPIQFFGPREITDTITQTLALDFS